MKSWRWAGWILVGLVVAGLWGVRTFRATPVALATVTEAPLEQTLVFSGRVAAPLRTELGATVTGRVETVSAREGDRVRAGQVLVSLEATDLQAQVAQAEAALRSAEARLTGQQELGAPTAAATQAQAQANLDAALLEARRSQDLFARGYVSQARIDDSERAVRIARAQLDAARAGTRANAREGSEAEQARRRVDEAQAALALARARLAQTRILAPTDGLIVARSVEPGQIVQPGRVLMGFAARGVTQLVGQADEKFLSQLALGQSTQAVADAFPQRPFPARILRIAPGIDAARGTVEVKFEVPDAPDFLREDMTLSFRVTTGQRERTATLPAGTVLGAGMEGRVRRIDADGRVTEQPVRLGLRSLERVEVLEGLAVGDAVLANPLAVKPGQRVRPVQGGEQPVRAERNEGPSGAGRAAAAMGTAIGGR